MPKNKKNKIKKSNENSDRIKKARFTRIPALKSENLVNQNTKNMKYIDKMVVLEEFQNSRKNGIILKSPLYSFKSQEFSFKSKTMFFDESIPVLLENNEYNEKPLKIEELVGMDDNEIIGLLSNFNGLLRIWNSGVLGMKEKFLLWAGENEKTTLNLRHKSIIWNILPFKSGNFMKVGLEENSVLKRLLKVYQEITIESFEFLWNFLCNYIKVMIKLEYIC